MLLNLEDVFQAARTFLSRTHGDTFLLRKYSLFENFDPSEARKTLGRFLYNFFKGDKQVIKVILDGEEIFTVSSRQRICYSVSIEMKEVNHNFFVIIKVYDFDKKAGEFLREAFGAELFSQQQIYFKRQQFARRGKAVQKLTDDFAMSLQSIWKI